MPNDEFLVNRDFLNSRSKHPHPSPFPLPFSSPFPFFSLPLFSWLPRTGPVTPTGRHGSDSTGRRIAVGRRGSGGMVGRRIMVGRRCGVEALRRQGMWHGGPIVASIGMFLFLFSFIFIQKFISIFFSSSRLFYTKNFTLVFLFWMQKLFSSKFLNSFRKTFSFNFFSSNFPFKFF